MNHVIRSLMIIKRLRIELRQVSVAAARMLVEPIKLFYHQRDIAKVLYAVHHHCS